jgi:Tfp pilus assembly protein PilW
MKKRPTWREKGMTLVEIMFASAFLVMILLVVSNICHKNLNAYKKVSAAEQRREETRFALESMLAELRQADTVTVPAADASGSTVTFTRPNATGTLRSGEAVTYTYDSFQKTVTRAGSLGGSVVVLKDVDALTFRRTGQERIDVELSIPGLGTGGSTSGSTYKSMSVVRKLITTGYGTVTAPVKTGDTGSLSLKRNELGGIW